jgi:hypothetical protein
MCGSRSCSSPLEIITKTIAQARLPRYLFGLIAAAAKGPANEYGVYKPESRD